MPSQFQLRDLLNHAIIGCVITFLFFLFFFLLFPTAWSRTAFDWNLIRANVSDVILLPALLVVVYVIGAIVPSWSSLALFGRPKDVIYRTLSTVRICAVGNSEDSPQRDALARLFLYRVAGRFHACEDAPDEHYDTLFTLASAYVLTQGQSMQQLDVERHFVLMHFNSRLCILFSFACLLSLLGLLDSLMARLGATPVLNAGPISFFFLSLLFYGVARSSATKAQNNCNHWQKLIIRSFIAIDAAVLEPVS